MRRLVGVFFVALVSCCASSRDNVLLAHDVSSYVLDREERYNAALVSLADKLPLEQRAKAIDEMAAIRLQIMRTHKELVIRLVDDYDRAGICAIVATILKGVRSSLQLLRDYGYSQEEYVGELRKLNVYEASKVCE